MGHFRKIGITKSLRDSFSFWILLGPLGFPFFGFFMLFLSDPHMVFNGPSLMLKGLPLWCHSCYIHRIYFLDPDGLVAWFMMLDSARCYFSICRYPACSYTYIYGYTSERKHMQHTTWNRTKRVLQSQFWVNDNTWKETRKPSIKNQKGEAAFSQESILRKKSCKRQDVLQLYAQVEDALQRLLSRQYLHGSIESKLSSITRKCYSKKNWKIEQSSN